MDKPSFSRIWYVSNNFPGGTFHCRQYEKLLWSAIEARHPGQIDVADGVGISREIQRGLWYVCISTNQQNNF